MVHGLLMARVPGDVADDLLQEVFLRAMVELDQLRDDGQFGGWIAAIARNRAVDHHRHFRELQSTHEIEDQLVAKADVGIITEAQAALAAIRSLPDTYRETLTMRLVEGMSGPEIASTTGLTRDSVRVNLHRGMNLLRERLNKAGSRRLERWKGMIEPTIEYLWNKAGAPDREVERLETLLGPYGIQPSQLMWQDAAVATRRAPRPLWFALLTAAALIIVAVVIRERFSWQPGEPWTVDLLAGRPQIAGVMVATRGKLAVGQAIETDSASRARIHVAKLGVIDIEPSSRIRLITTSEEHHRIRLERGTISAHMWAPPFSLAVDTPSAVLFDLGCAFVLHVEEDGHGIVSVSSGWVEFQTPSRNVIIPEGARAETIPEIGPGTPYLPDATAAFKAAVASFDINPNDEPARADAIRLVLANARPHDGLTLLNLLNEVTPQQREMIVDRLKQLVPLPSGYTQSEMVNLQTDALNSYWKALHLGSPKSWTMKWKDALIY